MLGPVPYWLLGCLALATVWGTTLLCALASVSYARALGRRAVSLSGSLREGTVASGHGEGDALASHTIAQVGRAMDGDPPAIVFSDKEYRGEVFGGTLDVAGEVVVVLPTASLEVWPDLPSQLALAKVEVDAALDALYKDARSSKGAARNVTVAFAKGKKVYFTTRSTRGGGELGFLSAEDPRAFFAARCRAHVLFALVSIVVCGALTVVAVRPPLFGVPSTIGGALLLAFFLVVQPVGVSVEEASREPFRRFLRGSSKRSAPFPGGVVPGRTTTQVETG